MTSTEQPLLDIVIAVHDPQRPLQRAIDSLLKSGLDVGGELRITVVCHNVPVLQIERTLTEEGRDAVRFEAVDDGRPSPAGPYMHGIRASTADYVAIMGSDDTLEPGALAAWLRHARDRRLTALIPAQRHASGGFVATPPVRLLRRGLLDPVRDRLPYRTAPLGLIRRSAVAELGLDMSSDLSSGSDQLFGLKLWFSGGRISYGAGLPHYVVGADAPTRVTTAIRPIEDELKAASSVFADAWLRSLPPRARRLIAAKYFRVHIIDAVHRRVNQGSWSHGEASAIRRLLTTMSEVGPGFERSLSLVDRRLLGALTSGDSDGEVLRGLIDRRKQYLRPSVWLTRSPASVFAIDAPLRFILASRFLRRGRSGALN